MLINPQNPISIQDQKIVRKMDMRQIVDNVSELCFIVVLLLVRSMSLRMKKKDLRVPPKGFDSVKGIPSPGGLRFNEYVVYHQSQVYPEYIIEYKML